MTRRILSMVLALVMVLSLCPQSYAVSETDTISVTDPGETTTKTGELNEIYLDAIFTDSEGHDMTYTLSEGNYGTHTKIAQDKDGRWMLSFTNPTAGTYTPTVTATCSNGATASCTLKYIVEKGEDGDDRQYGYDETDASSVKVYVTISSDGVPLMGNDGTILSNLEVNVPYFDLENQGLSDFYRYGTENGKGDYVNNTLIRRPTALHLYLYMIGVYYLGLTPEEVTTGAVQVLDHDGGQGVMTMNGESAYEDTNKALHITGSPTSLYMQQFWGHDENLMYYRNHVYPLMGPGWGSTADYILLSDGDTIDLAMFANWSFWQKGAFAAFDQDDYTTTAGGTVTFETVKYDTQSVADGGTEDFEPITGLDVKVYDADWQEVGTVAPASDKSNTYSYTFSKTGTYYLLATDPNAGDSSADSEACYAPATAKVTVEKAADVPVTGVELDKTELTLKAKETAQLKANVLPANAAERTVEWTTDREDVAAVDQTGLVTGVGEGTAVITATTKNGGFRASCTVQVTEPEVPDQDADGWYVINTGKQLKWFADQVNSGNNKINGRLGRDVDLSGICSAELGSWAPIGDVAADAEFQGNFDGQGHKVTGLYMKRTGNAANGDTYYSALFGLCNGSTIKNLSVYGEAWAVTRFVAGIVGRITNLAKNKDGALIENCHNYVEIKSDSTADTIYGYAGVVASAQDVTIRNCSNQASVSGVKGSVGGILGVATYGTVTIENCWNTGDVKMNESYYTYSGVGGILGVVENGTAHVTNCRNTGSVTVEAAKAVGARAAGIAGYVKSGAGLELANCYNTGLIGGNVSAAGRANGIFGDKASGTTVTAANCYYLDTSAPASKKEVTGAEVKTAAAMHAASFAALLGDGYQASCPYPVLTVEKATDHSFDKDGVCTVCGMVLVPTRKEGYPAETSATVQTGKAYLLSDLQNGKIFEPVSGKTLNYKNYYYERSADGGKTWEVKTGFAEAIFGATTIQITETKAGEYVYRFYASHDGVNFSDDTWTLRLTVEDQPEMNFTFFMGKDYTGSYPVLKLYNVDTDDQGNEVLGEEITDCFRYSDFTETLPEGQEEYDPALGTLVKNYQTFYVTLRAGRYAYRAFAKNADTGEYDVALGGMTLDLPTDSNVDGNAGGGTNIYLVSTSFYVTSQKLDKTYFTKDEYHVRVDCPIMKTSAVMGDAYIKGSYTYYPTVLYAGGNSCLYNSYAYPDIDGYIFTQNINQTFQPSTSASTKSMTINTAIELKVTVPVDAEFGLYFQWNNFNTTEVAPVYGDDEVPYADRWKDNGNGTKTATYDISKGNSNYTWRLTDPNGVYVTKAGWLASQQNSAEVSYSFAETDPTDKLSQDRSKLGTQVAKRDEADLQINLDPSGYKAISDTTRVRAYRHWELINSDAGNIMLEPDFNWTLLTGNAQIETVNGGNASANWADVTPGTEDSIITVSYDSVNVNPEKYGTHGGLFPATNPVRVGVIVVGGTGVPHGSADAKVAYNMASGVTTTRSADWDYNYDTWYYNAEETDPKLDFTVTSNGETTVEYAFVTATEALTASVSGFTAVTAENGAYTVPLTALGKGGTVIIRMTDSTGVSYRLVRAAEVTVTTENVTNPKEAIMPGDQVKLTFSGMFRAVNKISGIFNPTTFQPTYFIGEQKFAGTLKQYERMDNASVTVTIPEDLTFAEGQETAQCLLTNGYTYGSMYSAANPFAFLYNMTDTGVGTNFNAVTVNYYMNHYADVSITVARKVLYTVDLAVQDDSGAAVTGVIAEVKDAKGNLADAAQDGTFSLGYGTYTYTLIGSGYVTTRGSFTLTSADADKLVGGKLTISVTMSKSGENGWDGKTLTEPAKDTDGAYLIGTGAELAWFAKNGGQGSAKLTADIELAGCDWTPMTRFYGTFDGQGHVIHNLYVNSTSYPVGLFGYLQDGATVKNLGVTGDVTTTNTSYGQAGGIAGFMNDNSVVEKCFSAVNVTAGKHGGGIAGYTDTAAVIRDCYTTGTITTLSANECYLGGICGSYYTQYAGAKLTNCYSTATVIGSGGSNSYVGGLSPIPNDDYFINSYYLEGTVSKARPAGISGKGVSKTAEELKALAPTLGDAFTADSTNINNGYPVLTWQVPTPQIVLGDVDGDGEVTPMDAVLAYAIANGEQEATAEQLTAADVDGDGEITPLDAVLIYAFCNGELSKFPVQG